MKRVCLLLLFCLCLPPAAAEEDDKARALKELFAAYGADGGNVNSLLALRYAVNAALADGVVAAVAADESLLWGDKGPVVVEFSDYACGYCRRVFPYFRDFVAGGEARVLILEFPILGPMSERAARYALAARKQGRYDEFHAALMSAGGRLSEEMLDAAVAEVGLDAAALRADAEDAAVSAELNRNYQLAALMGVRSTPSFIINGAVVKGALRREDFERLLTESAPAE